MEDKEIVTVVKKITDADLIKTLALSEKSELVQYITDSKSIEEIILKTLPVSNLPKVKIKLRADEDLVYLGVYDITTNKFLEEMPSKNSNVNNLRLLFKASKSNKIVKLNYNELTQNELIAAVDLKNIAKHYAVTYSDLQQTKLVLGLYNSKMQFANTRINEYEVNLYEVYTLNNASSYILTTALPGLSSKHDDTGKVKFCIKDLLFIPLLNKKGYNIPKDRTINVNQRISFKYKGENKVGTIQNIVDSPQFYTCKKGNKVGQVIYFVRIDGSTELIRLRRQDFKPL